jgi:hypothetical protein
MAVDVWVPNGGVVSTAGTNTVSDEERNEAPDWSQPGLSDCSYS